MPRRPEFSSYVFIKNDLGNMGWNTKNPSRNDSGQLYAQQECLDNAEIKAGLQNQRPEYMVKVHEDLFWVIVAKVTHEQIDAAFNEAIYYANEINKSKLIKARIVTGVSGTDEDGYFVNTAYISLNGDVNLVKYNGKHITGFLSPDQARFLVENDTADLNELVTDEAVLLSIAENVNEELHRASINKDSRATVISSVLLSMISDTLPNFKASPDIFIKDINNRVEDTLIQHNKRQFAEYIELKLPQEDSARNKHKVAIVKVFFLLRKINIKAAMNGSQDLLGKFYEVFLKYGNGAKDIGIVLTPRHITVFAAEVLDIKSTDLVFDPACGTGGFLVAAYDRVRKNEPLEVEMFKKHRIFGVEFQANVATLAIVNMIFRGDGKNNIINSDCLTVNLNIKIRNNEISAEYRTEPGERKPVTKVLMNPPFALKREDEQEFTFINHALDQMADEGLLLSIVPVSVMYSGSRELAWRKQMLRNNTLVSVMSFPNDLFYPQASVEPLIVVIKKGVSQKATDKCLFVRITDDGLFKLKKRRLPHGKQNQLETLQNDIKTFINGGTVTEIKGVIQAKIINLNDPGLELIPQQYLDNSELNLDVLKRSISTLQAEIIFQEIRRGLSK